jgi:hypothetical protein
VPRGLEPSRRVGDTLIVSRRCRLPPASFSFERVSRFVCRPDVRAAQHARRDPPLIAARPSDPRPAGGVDDPPRTREAISP